MLRSNPTLLQLLEARLSRRYYFVQRQRDVALSIANICVGTKKMGML